MSKYHVLMSESLGKTIEVEAESEDEDSQADYDLREKMETYLGSCTHE